MRGFQKIILLLLPYICLKVGEIVTKDPDKVGLMIIGIIPIIIGIADSTIAAGVVLGIIYFGSLFDIPLSLAKLAGGGFVAWHFGTLIVKKETILLSNNPFLFVYAGIFMLAGVVNGLGLVNYPNKILLFNFATYFMVRYFLRDMKNVRKFLKLYCCIVFLVGIVVLYQGYQGHRLLTSGETISEFGNSSNNFGVFIILCFPISIFFALFEKKIWQKRFFVFVSGFFVLLTVWCASRTAFLGLLIAILGYMFFLKRSNFNFFLKLLTAACIIVIAFIPNDVLQYSTDRYLNRTPGTQASTESRIILTKGALLAFKEKPVLGSGPIEEEMRNRIYRYVGYYKPSHSTPLSLLLKTGLVGFTAFYLIFVYSLFGLRKSMRYFKKFGNEKNRWLSIAVLITLVAFLTSSIFLHLQDFKSLFIFLGVSQVIIDRAKTPIHTRSPITK